MCGIVGYTGDERPGLLDAMLARIAHRGPDGTGFHSEPGAHLAACRLAIVDRANGVQPRSDEAGERWVVQNGEIYNHAALRAELERGGHRFRTVSDTEAIVHLFEERGAAALTALEGMFALAVWDRPRRALTLARDRLGEKPLYWTRVHGELFFASEIKALFAVPGVAAAVDHAALDEYLALQYETGDRTMFSGISKLPPGHLLEFARGELAVRRWWTPPEAGTGTLEPGELAGLLEASVKARLPDEVASGCFLSGGVDSGIVAALMAPHATRLATFTVGFDSPGAADERREAAQLARSLGADHHELVVGAPTAAELVRIGWQLDHPCANPATLALDRLARLARESVTVVLTGEGADELFGGYGKYAYPRLAAGLNRTLGRTLGRALARVPARGRLARLAKLGRVLIEDDPDRRFDRVNAVFDQATRAALVPGGRARAAGELVAAVCGPARPGASILDRMMRFDLAGYLPEDNLMKVDRATMAHGLEARAPFLDTGLVERALAAPAEARAGRGAGKSVLRAAAARLLPHGGAARPKQAFELPVASWLAGPWAPLVDAVLDPGYLAGQRLFDPVVVAAVRAGGGARAVWTLVAFQLWYLRFCEDPAHAQSRLAPVLDPAGGAAWTAG